jgi:hypothetical protein
MNGTHVAWPENQASGAGIGAARRQERQGSSKRFSRCASGESGGVVTTFPEHTRARLALRHDCDHVVPVDDTAAPGAMRSRHQLRNDVSRSQ